MPGRMERTYGKFLRCMCAAVNPFKNAVKVTECEVHKFINRQAVEILKNDKFQDAYHFFSDYLPRLNAGVVWADQDLKSMGHFYNPYRGRGLYGNNNAASLALEYYRRALYYWKQELIDSSMFYLGASLHLVQDMTVPQHANIRLLGSHKKYENFIKRMYLKIPCFTAESGGYYHMRCIEEAIACNARNAIKIYSRLKKMEDEEKRFYTITKFILPLAQRTTAGCLMMFYRDVFTQPGKRNAQNRTNKFSMPFTWVLPK
ncbi:MAG: zinc dependent phospholipase C family protein [Clostridiales bacterium]|nr:zinc dependent phospholipase C family protein [Eubacteriales bacterium]MDH7566058.1 zinc dependent phospholipase C family protein [Clostridiales bacterium]